MAKRKIPHLIYQQGLWYVAIPLPGADFGSCLGNYNLVEPGGRTPEEALDSYYGIVTIAKRAIARGHQDDAQKELAGKCGKLSVEEVFEEGHRIVLDEVLRIGKKVLPVILALVAGFLIGRLYG